MKREKVGIVLMCIITYLYYVQINPIYVCIILSLLHACEFYFMVGDTDSRYYTDIRYYKQFLTFFLLYSYTLYGVWSLSTVYLHDRDTTLYIISTVTLSDILQYYIGKHFGRNRIGYPSPNKTFEAYVFGPLLTAIIVSYYYPIFPTYMLTVCGIFGDLLVSYCKRQLGLKDIYFS